MGWIGDSLEPIRFLRIRHALTHAVSLGLIAAMTLVIWKGLIHVTGSESPVVVVLSESMEPGFKRGDILFLHMSKDPIRSGEIVVFNVVVSVLFQMIFTGAKVVRTRLEHNVKKLVNEGRDIPIVHRVIKVHERQDTGAVDVLTKGDNNDVDDRSLYAHGQLWLQQQHIIGRAVGFLPYAGWATIIMTEKPVIKYVLIGALGLLAITSKE